jgi:hypothetical protein
MEIIVILRIVFMIPIIIVSNVVTFLLYNYYCSILYVKRNILTYLNVFIIFIVNFTVTTQVKGLVIQLI